MDDNRCLVLEFSARKEAWAYSHPTPDNRERMGVWTLFTEPLGRWLTGDNNLFLELLLNALHPAGRSIDLSFVSAFIFLARLDSIDLIQRLIGFSLGACVGFDHRFGLRGRARFHGQLILVTGRAQTADRDRLLNPFVLNTFQEFSL